MAKSKNNNEYIEMDSLNHQLETSKNTKQLKKNVLFEMTSFNFKKMINNVYNFSC